MSEPVIESWFPTLIYKEKLQQYSEVNSYLESKAYSLKKINPTVQTDWKGDTYNTLGIHDPMNDNDIVINNLIELCAKKVHLFANQFGVTRPISDLLCREFWFNIAGTGNYQEYHQHTASYGKSHFSLVYYVKTYKDCGNIVFLSPSASSDMYPLPIDDNNFNVASYQSCTYTPENSLMLIFKSNLFHKVEENRNDTDRISISMNFMYKD